MNFAEIIFIIINRYDVIAAKENIDFQNIREQGIALVDKVAEVAENPDLAANLIEDLEGFFNALEKINKYLSGQHNNQTYDVAQSVFFEIQQKMLELAEPAQAEKLPKDEYTAHSFSEFIAKSSSDDTPPQRIFSYLMYVLRIQATKKSFLDHNKSHSEDEILSGLQASLHQELPGVLPVEDFFKPLFDFSRLNSNSSSLIEKINSHVILYGWQENSRLDKTLRHYLLKKLKDYALARAGTLRDIPDAIDAIANESVQEDIQRLIVVTEITSYSDYISMVDRIDARLRLEVDNKYEPILSEDNADQKKGKVERNAFREKKVLAITDHFLADLDKWLFTDKKDISQDELEVKRILEKYLSSAEDKKTYHEYIKRQEIQNKFEGLKQDYLPELRGSVEILHARINKLKYLFKGSEREKIINHLGTIVTGFENLSDMTGFMKILQEFNKFRQYVYQYEMEHYPEIQKIMAIGREVYKVCESSSHFSLLERRQAAADYHAGIFFVHSLFLRDVEENSEGGLFKKFYNRFIYTGDSDIRKGIFKEIRNQLDKLHTSSDPEKFRENFISYLESLRKVIAQCDAEPKSWSKELKGDLQKLLQAAVQGVVLRKNSDNQANYQVEFGRELYECIYPICASALLDRKNVELTEFQKTLNATVTELQGILPANIAEEIEDSKACFLYSVAELPANCEKNSYIFIDKPQLFIINRPKLYYVNEYGKPEKVKITNITEFRQKLGTMMEGSTEKLLTAEQIKNLVTSNGGHCAAHSLGVDSTYVAGYENAPNKSTFFEQHFERAPAPDSSKEEPQLKRFSALFYEAFRARAGVAVLGKHVKGSATSQKEETGAQIQTAAGFAKMLPAIGATLSTVLSKGGEFVAAEGAKERQTANEASTAQFKRTQDIEQTAEYLSQKLPQMLAFQISRLGSSVVGEVADLLAQRALWALADPKLAKHFSTTSLASLGKDLIEAIFMSDLIQGRANFFKKGLITNTDKRIIFPESGWTLEDMLKSGIEVIDAQGNISYYAGDDEFCKPGQYGFIRGTKELVQKLNYQEISEQKAMHMKAQAKQGDYCYQSQFTGLENRGDESMENRAIIKELQEKGAQIAAQGVQIQDLQGTVQGLQSTVQGLQSTIQELITLIKAKEVATANQPPQLPAASSSSSNAVSLGTSSVTTFAHPHQGRPETDQSSSPAVSLTTPTI